jgi:hypothetical protein
MLLVAYAQRTHNNSQHAAHPHLGYLHFRIAPAIGMRTPFVCGGAIERPGNSTTTPPPHWSPAMRADDVSEQILDPMTGETNC